MAVLTTRKASVLFASHDPMRPYMDTVLALANSVGKPSNCLLELRLWIRGASTPVPPLAHLLVTVLALASWKIRFSAVA